MTDLIEVSTDTLTAARDAMNAAQTELRLLREERTGLEKRLKQARAIWDRELQRDHRLGPFDEFGQPRESTADGAGMNCVALQADLTALEAEIAEAQTIAEAAAAVWSAADQAERQREADARAHLLIEHADLVGECRAILRDLDRDRTDPHGWEAYAACYARFQALRRRGPFDRQEYPNGTFSPPAAGFGGLWWPPDPVELLVKSQPVADPLITLKRTIADTLTRCGADELAVYPAPVPSLLRLAGLEKGSRE
jgi:hypothetical protein